MASGGWTHVLSELSPLTGLDGPRNRSARLRYTCVSVSKKYIALGSNIGGVYIFTRDTLKHLQVVYGDTESSALSVTALSPNESFVAYATGSGHVVVMEMNIEKRQKPERVRLSTDHVANVVTCLQWDAGSSRVYVGDSVGKISVTYIPSSKAKTLFIQPSEVILRLDTSVVQLDWWDDKLLVSTWTRSYLLNTNRQQYSQIGKKLRDGEYGACFFLEPSSQYPVIYCSRPGSRVWEVDFDANVLNTHQFKQLLAIPPLPVIHFHNTDIEFADPQGVYQPQSVGFNKLCRLGPYLITWAGRRVYVFDPVRVRIILWNEQHTGVKDIVTSSTEIFIFREDQTVARFHLLPVERCLQLLLAKQVWSVAGQLLCYLDNFVAVPFIQRHISIGSIRELVSRLNTEDKDVLADKVQDILDEISSLSDSADGDSVNGDVIDGKSTETAVKLPSGIFLVNNGLHTSESDLYGLDLDGARFTSASHDTNFDQGLQRTSSIDQGIQRTSSVDQLEIESSIEMPGPEDVGMRKSFSTTALDSMSERHSFQLPAVDTASGGDNDGGGEGKEITEREFTNVVVEEEGDVFVDQKQAETDSVSAVAPPSLLEDAPPVIAEPLVIRKKTGRRKKVTQVDIPSAGISTSDIVSGKAKIRRSASTGSLKKTGKKKELKSMPSISFPIQEEDSDRNLYTKIDQDPDTISTCSIDTISSIASEESQTGDVTPDSVSLEGDNVSLYSNTRSRTPIFPTDEDSIPPLLQRLSAGGVSAEDTGSKDGSPISQSSLAQSFDSTASGSPQSSSNSPKLSLLSVKESISSKLSKSKSFIQTMRKKSPLGKPSTGHPLDPPAPETEGDNAMSVEEEQKDNDKENTSGSTLTDPLAGLAVSVELQDLESATTMTKRKLQDVSLLLKPDALKSLLLDWITVLHKTLQKLHQEVDKERKVKVMDRQRKKRERNPSGNDGKRNKTDGDNENEQNSNNRNDAAVKSEILEEADEFKEKENGDVDDIDVRDKDESEEGKDNGGETDVKVDKNERSTEFAKGTSEQTRQRHISAENGLITNGDNNGKLSDCPANTDNTQEEESDKNFIPMNWTNVFHFRDPFRLSYKLRTDVAELCVLCFNAGCNGNILKYIESVSTKIEGTSDKNNDSDQNQSGVNEDCSIQCSKPKNSKCENFTCEYCERCDVKMAMIVRCYFWCFTLDQLRKTIGSWESNWFHTWQAIVKGSQALGKSDPVSEKISVKDFQSAKDLLRSLILPNKQAFIGHVAGLFAASSSQAVKFGAEVPKLVSLQDMYNMCRLLTVPSPPSLTKYVQHRLGEMPSYLRLQVVSQLCTKQYLTLILLESLLTTSTPVDSSQRSIPRPGSHLMPRENGDIIDCLLDMCTKQSFQEALNICKAQGYWRGCLYLWRGREMSSWQHMLELIAQLGDIALLDDSHDYGYLPKTPEEWHYLLQCYRELQTSQSRHSDWPNTLTWDGLAELMLKTIGPRDTVSLLQDFNIPEGQLNTQFFQTCIMQAILQKQQRLVVHNMLEKVDTYLWAKKQPHLAPQVLHAVTAEKKGRSSKDDRQEYQQLFSRLSIKHHSEGRTVEDAESHWGVAAHVMGGCRNCSLPLTETVSHIVPGVIIFSCGHSFHKFCVPMKTCPLCDHEPRLTKDHHLV